MKTHPVTLISALGLAFAASAVQAQNDRIIDTPTGWIYLYGATSTQINSQISNGWRPFSIDRAGAGYDTVFVHNSGSYQISGSTATFGRTATSMESYLSANNLRLLDLEVYDNGSGGTLMSAITVPNSGATSTPGWGWLYNVQFSDVVTWLNANPTLRLLDLDVYTIGGTRYYSAVAVHNSGNNAQGWWYYNNITAAQVTQNLTTNGARLVHIELVSPGSIVSPSTYACVMVSSNPGAGWWYTNLTSNQVADHLAQNGARLTALKRYTNFSGQERFAVAMVDNANPVTRRMRTYMSSALSDGSYGFMLKRVGGPVLANLNQDFAFEPASMLKILHATYAVRQCSLNADSLTSNIFVRDRCNPNECPDNVQCNAGNEQLQVAIRAMMEQSDNNRTWEIENRYGTTTLNNFASSRGLASTQLNHRLGCLCGNPFNTFSCSDAVSLYEQIADGSLFNSNWKDTLFELMIDLDNAGWGAYPTLNTIINQEAASTNLTASEISAFRAAMRYANKGGGYSCSGTFYRTEGGWASIPFKVPLLGSYIIQNREYAIATFVHGNNSSTESQVAYRAKEEILREEIRAALESWDAACTSPGFLSHPSNQIATVGGSTAFSAAAAGSTSNRTFRWQRQPGGTGGWTNMSDITGRFSGTGTSTLSIANIQLSDAGNYRLVVTNDCGVATSNAASLTVNTTTSCYANCDNSTIAPILNVADFSCFLQKFAAGDPYANCDQSTTAPVLNVADFGCFLQRFAAGCS